SLNRVNDYHFLESFKRKRIKLTTKLCVFTGVVQRISLNKTIVLEDVVEETRNTKLCGAKLFFGHEILNIEIPNLAKLEDPVQQSRPNPGQQMLPVAEFQPYRRSLLLDDEDEQHVNYVVVDEFHEKFGPAVMHIKKQQVVGIGSDGVGVFQHERLCWLQIGTKNKVYLFDILLLGSRAFKNGLSMILESKHILKVIHDCRGIAGSLLAQFGVSLTNVFDTQIADVLHFYEETGGYLPDRVSTLEEVVSFHLKMPLYHLSSLKIKAQLVREDREVWYVRPCPAPLLKVMALSVIHLQPLRLVLLDALMSDYTTLVNFYLSGNQDTPVPTQNINSRIGLELPRELRELEVIRQERQEWAVGHYPVTEDGLLERYKPRPSTETEARSTDADLEQSSAASCQLEEISSQLEAASSMTSPSQDLQKNLPISTTFPVLGRGFNISTPPLQPPRGGLKNTVGKINPEPGASSCLDSESQAQPISIMAGVATTGSYPFSAMSMGRGFLHTSQ
uniref:3'-5' exonuclease domain-containing protein n=1 Tax=Astyanax mexicanus TaxID=7994 RepID=W5LUA5_ASTMX